MEAEPGTLIMSPKVAMMTSSRERLNSIILFMSEAEVTQTGQPGPDISRMVGGSASLMPYLEMECVWVPHISIMLTGFLETSRIRPMMACAPFLALNSSMYFMAVLSPQ